MILVQQIHVCWSKKSRGVPGSINRTAVPKAISIDLEECLFLYEKYVFNEVDGFKQTREIHMIKGLIPDQVGNIILKYQNEELVVRFYKQWGIPKWYDKKPVLHLSPGMSGRLMINGKPDIDWYIQDVYNIAVANQPTQNLFTSQDPDKICDLRRNLY
jgi:hypothetical protein